MTRRMICALTLGVMLPAAARADVPLPTGGTIKHVDFERHVMGLLSKTGCNAGSCHGSFQGKNGFRVSLFGYDPAMDHAALTRDNLGRRINLVHPDESLLLLKGAGLTPHEGGVRFGKGSWTYEILRQWIAGGGKWTPGSGKIEKLTVTPAQFAVLPAEKSLQLNVTATFADGTTEDITPFCDFKISDDSIASVTPLGQLTARQPGDAGLTVVYRGSVQAIRVLVPAPALKGGYPTVPAVNYIDREIFAKLKLLNMVPSDLASDEVFLRRIYIDTTGQLPEPEQIRTFLADKDTKKREKIVDELLKHPLHAALWATKFSDVTGNNTDALEVPQQFRPKRSQMWHDWFRKRIADNMPYDEIVRNVLTATTSDGKDPEEWIAFMSKVEQQASKGGTTDYPEKTTLDLFWRRQQQVPIEQWGEKVAAAFLGIRLECAQCHKHPTDRWTQEEYWAFANIFSQVTFANNQFSSRDVKAAADKENAARRAKFEGKKVNNNQIILVRELFVNERSRMRPNPATNRTPTPKTLGGPEIEIKSGEDARAELAKWITSPDNPFFAKSFVNRVWAHYFGKGLVDPVDDFSLANAPSNARLLDALAADFTKSGFDIRRLERAILLSRTYQLGYDTNDSNKFDTNNFSHAYIRPLMAEQVVDVLNSALGVSERFAGQDEMPAGTKMVEVGASRIQNQNLAYVLRIFGRPPRTTACDCERAMEPALPQTLFRMTDQNLLAKFTERDGRTLEIARAKMTDEETVDEVFLSTLSRLPSAQERADAVKHMGEAKTRQDAVTDLMWALVNTREFILNH